MKNRTVFQIKQKMIQQLGLSLSWSHNEMADSNSLSENDVIEIQRIQNEIRNLIINIDEDVFEVTS